MDLNILQTVGRIAGIGGLAIGVMLIIFREIIRRKIFPQLTKRQAYQTIRLILILTWSIAIVGIGAWMVSKRVSKLDTYYAKLVPLHTGWIFIGYYALDKEVYLEGPAASVVYRPTSAIRGNVLPEIGDVLLTQQKRHVRIADYRLSGLKNQMISPALIHEELMPADSTGVYIPSKTLVIVRDVEISRSSDRTPSVWVRIAACEPNSENCKKAEAEIIN